jgi:hypothetical protein
MAKRRDKYGSGNGVWADKAGGAVGSMGDGVCEPAMQPDTNRTNKAKGRSLLRIILSSWWTGIKLIERRMLKTGSWALNAGWR